MRRDSSAVVVVLVTTSQYLWMEKLRQRLLRKLAAVFTRSPVPAVGEPPLFPECVPEPSVQDLSAETEAIVRDRLVFMPKQNKSDYYALLRVRYGVLYCGVLCTAVQYIRLWFSL